MTMLAAVADVKKDIGIPVEDTSKDDVLAAWIEAASHVVETYAHRLFSLSERTENFEGGLKNLVVSAYPVASVKSVVADGKAVEGYVVDSERGIVHLKEGFGSRRGASGYEVQITYTGGFAEADMPSAVKMAARVLARRLYESADDEGQLVQAEKLGDYSITYAKYSVKDDASGLGVFCPAAALLIKSVSGRGF